MSVEGITFTEIIDKIRNLPTCSTDLAHAALDAVLDQLALRGDARDLDAMEL